MVGRSRRPLGVTIIALAQVVLLSGVAQADDMEAAKQAYSTASRFFQAEEYEAALPLFQQAYRLSNQRPATIFALAQCERSLKLYDAAMAHFKEYLATNPPDAANVKETITLLGDLIAVHNQAEAKKKAEAEARAAEQAKKDQAARDKQRAAAQAEAQRLAQAAVQKELAAAAQRRAEAEVAAPSVPPPPPVAQPVAPAPDLTASAPASDEDDGSVLSSPWFWTITSVIVVGGAVASGVLLTRSDEPQQIYGGSTGVVLGR